MSRMKTPNRRRSSAVWRGSPQGWLDGAYDLLITSGIDSVKILALARRLKLSRTSFYWFFRDRDSLLAALLERWRSRNTDSLVRQADQYAETITEAVLAVFDCWFDSKLFDARFEFAVRSWAQQSPKVAAELKVADELRLNALKQMFIRFHVDPRAADVRARSLYLTQIGYISLKSEEPLAVRMGRIAHYCNIFSGKNPSKSELNRFFARHYFSSSDIESQQLKKNEPSEVLN